MENKNKKEVHIVFRIIGVASIIIGLLGLVLPVIPGIPILIFGLLILGEESVVTGWIINKLPKNIQNKIYSIFKVRRK